MSVRITEQPPDHGVRGLTFITGHNGPKGITDLSAGVQICDWRASLAHRHAQGFLAKGRWWIPLRSVETPVA